jgi:hypothetical protein
VKWRPRWRPVPAVYERTDCHDSGGREFIEHLNGVDWFAAPVPPRLHACWPQTRARLNGELWDRCACGAFRLGGRRPWIERNTRRPRTRARQGAAG